MSTLRYVLLLLGALVASLIAGAAIGILAFFLLSAATAAPAKSHEWYDYACCEDKDCDVIGWDELTFNQANRIWTWKSKRSGWTHYIHEDSISPIDRKKRIRVSKDGLLHGCERNTADKPGDPPRWTAYCIYFPAGL